MWRGNNLGLILWYYLEITPGNPTVTLHEIFEGPSFSLGRNRHACGILTEQNQRKFVVIAGGFSWNVQPGPANEFVEYLDVTNGISSNTSDMPKWQVGTNIHFYLEFYRI